MQSTRGMTLVEAVIWVTMTSLIMLSLMQSVLYFYRTNSYAIEQGLAVTSGQRGVDNMMKIIREAAFSSNGAWPIISMSPTSFSFYADIDADPFIEQVTFYLTGNSLIRAVVDPTGDPPTYANPEVTNVISDNVRNTEQGFAVFEYYDVNGNRMTDLSKIAEVRFVETTIVVNINPNRLPNQFTLRSSAMLRNLK